MELNDDTLAELKITRDGLARARSQPMRNTLGVIEQEFLGRLAEGESGKFMERLMDEILMQHWPDDGPVLDYDVNAPDGSRIEIRSEPMPKQVLN